MNGWICHIFLFPVSVKESGQCKHIPYMKQYPASVATIGTLFAVITGLTE
jgi:hypothetical protein